jgi:hypothetical protein
LPDDLSKQAKGTGRGSELINKAKEYADKTGKKLVIQDATKSGEPFWDKQTWLSKQPANKKPDGYMEQNYEYVPKK